MELPDQLNGHRKSRSLSPAGVNQGVIHININNQLFIHDGLSISATIRKGTLGGCPTLKNKKFKMVRPIGLEPMTCRLEVCCSIQLSYGRTDERRTPVSVPLW